MSSLERNWLWSCQSFLCQISKLLPNINLRSKSLQASFLWRKYFSFLFSEERGAGRLYWYIGHIAALSSSTAFQLDLYISDYTEHRKLSQPGLPTKQLISFREHNGGQVCAHKDLHQSTLLSSLTLVFSLILPHWRNLCGQHKFPDKKNLTTTVPQQECRYHQLLKSSAARQKGDITQHCCPRDSHICLGPHKQHMCQRINWALQGSFLTLLIQEIQLVPTAKWVNGYTLNSFYHKVMTNPNGNHIFILFCYSVPLWCSTKAYSYPLCHFFTFQFTTTSIIAQTYLGPESKQRMMATAGFS